MASSNIACHPRVVQLRVYQDLPLEESHPQKCIYPTAPKSKRSSTKRAASTVDRDQLATCVGGQGVRKNVKIAHAQSSYRVPFRNIQNNYTNQLEFEPSLKIVNTKKYCRDAPEPPSHKNHLVRANLKKRPRVLSSSAPSAANHRGTRDAMRSTHVPTPLFPSGFTDYGSGSGYSTIPTLRYSRAETDHPNILDLSALPPKPVKRRMALPRGRSMSMASNGEYSAMGGYEDGNEERLNGCSVEDERVIEERDISEVDLSDFK